MSYYSSNQKKQAAYLSLRKAEETNSDIQQNKLYQKLALERGEIEQATNLAKLASSIFNKAISPTPPVPKVDGLSVLARAVSEGKLDQVVKQLASVNDPSLSEAANNAKKLFNDPAFKASVNEKLSQVVELQKSQPRRVANVLIEEMTKSPLFNKMKDAQEGLDELASSTGSTEATPSEFSTFTQANLSEVVPEPIANALTEKSAKNNGILVSLNYGDFKKISDNDLKTIAIDPRYYNEFMKKSKMLEPKASYDKSKVEFREIIKNILEEKGIIAKGNQSLDNRMLDLNQ